MISAEQALKMASTLDIDDRWICDAMGELDLLIKDAVRNKSMSIVYKVAQPIEEINVMTVQQLALRVGAAGYDVEHLPYPKSNPQRSLKISWAKK